MKTNNTPLFYRSCAIAAAIALPGFSFAGEDAPAATVSYFSNPLFNTLLLIIIVLAIMVAVLSSALKNIISSDLFQEKIKRAKEKVNSGAAKTSGLLLLFLFSDLSVYSQEKAAQAIADNRIGGLDQLTFYIMVVMIGIELIALALLFNTFKNILADNTEKKAGAELKPKGKTLLDKLNDTVEIEQEESIMLDHDYDGIKELDNNLPPWWKYGFYLTILIAVIYLVNYHVFKTAPLQGEEYKLSIKKAEAEIAEYMKTSANNVDESTVKELKEPADLAAGKDIFIATCAACHGKYGEGTVGPNLTDDYWLHGGGIKDLFKTIKYGWPDKGMKSWKEDLSPIQIAQVASYIRTLKGTNPPKPKDKQGELYIEQALAPADSSTVKDSTKTMPVLPVK